MRLGQALRAGLAACAAFAAVALGPVTPARAQIGSERYAAIVLDHRSGDVLVAANADETRHPASLTKMMTLYMVFEALRDGRLTLQSRVTFSAEAASRPPSKLGVPAGQSISVEQAILSLVTRSANDAATAVGETLGGSEPRFAQMMTLRARALGMSRTTFRNASGLPDPDQVTTARDMATLGRRLVEDFPNRYHYFGISHAQFGGVRIRNHNRMLESYQGVDGIKTGFINASGFNIVTSATRGGRRLVGAVFGGRSWTERDQHMASLLDRGFDRIGLGEARPTSMVVRTATAAPLPGARTRPAQASTATTEVRRTATRPTTTRSRRAASPPARAQARQTASRPARAATRQAATRPTTRQAARQGAAQPTRTARTTRAAQPTRTAAQRQSTTTRSARSGGETTRSAARRTSN